MVRLQLAFSFAAASRMMKLRREVWSLPSPSVDDLAERLGRTVHELEADAGHLGEIGAADGIVLAHRAVGGRLAETADPGLHAEDRLLLGVHEFDGVGGVILTQRHRGAECFICVI